MMRWFEIKCKIFYEFFGILSLLIALAFNCQFFYGGSFNCLYVSYVLSRVAMYALGGGDYRKNARNSFLCCQGV